MRSDDSVRTKIITCLPAFKQSPIEAHSESLNWKKRYYRVSERNHLCARLFHLPGTHDKIDYETDVDCFKLGVSVHTSLSRTLRASAVLSLIGLVVWRRRTHLLGPGPPCQHRPPSDTAQIKELRRPTNPPPMPAAALPRCTASSLTNK